MARMRIPGQRKNPASARNGKGKAIRVLHGNTSALRSARLNKSSPEYKFEQRYIGDLIQHVGGADNLTTPMLKLIEMAGRTYLLEKLAAAEALRSGFTTQAHTLSPAFTAYMQSSARHIELLRMLGLERHQKPLPTLGEYLNAQQQELDA